MWARRRSQYETYPYPLTHIINIFTDLTLLHSSFAARLSIGRASELCPSRSVTPSAQAALRYTPSKPGPHFVLATRPSVSAEHLDDAFCKRNHHPRGRCRRIVGRWHFRRLEDGEQVRQRGQQAVGRGTSPLRRRHTGEGEAGETFSSG